MHKFWYHSPVRFYKTIKELEDMTNSQNASWFGGRKEYPLEVRSWHRFLVPIYDNGIEGGEYALYVSNCYQKKEIDATFGVESGELKWVSFYADEEISGTLELINKDTGKTEFYSNPIKFLDSTDYYGRKYIRIATKHSYNRNHFDFEDEEAWFITNLPAYNIGHHYIEADISTARTGGNSSLRIKETHLDEVEIYHIETNGDPNILNFLQVHSTNEFFFIDGVQKVCVEKLDQDEYAMSGKVKFTNLKDENGLNILFDEKVFFE